MTDLIAIERAVQQLPAEQLAAFRNWFSSFDEVAWDAQVERDAAGGKLDALAAEALADFRSGGGAAL